MQNFGTESLPCVTIQKQNFKTKGDFIMATLPEGIYTFESVYGSPKRLNLYFDGSIDNGQNVVLYRADGSLEQQWRYKNKRLYNRLDVKYVLDRYTGSNTYNNADIWAENLTEYDADQRLVITFESGSSDIVTIKLEDENTYLTVSDNLGNGSKTGKYPTSTGNVYWKSTTTITDKQRWKAISVAENDYTQGSTVYTPKEGFYRFTKKGTKTALNYQNTSSVNIYSWDGSTDQIWKLTENRLFSESNTACGLKNVNNSVQISTAPDSLDFVKVGDHEYKIRKQGTGSFLSTNGSSFVWNSTDTPVIWKIDRLIKQTGIPNDGDPKGGSNPRNEYFAEWAHLSNLGETYYRDYLDEKARELYCACFPGSNPSGYQKNLNPFGAIYVGSTIDTYSGKFHTGIDLAQGEGTRVASPISGTLVSSSSYYGTVIIESRGVRWLFLHMKNRIANEPGKAIAVGDTLGYVSGIGSQGTVVFNPHLHVEVQTADSTEATGFAYQENSYSSPEKLLDVTDFIVYV